MGRKTLPIWDTMASLGPINPFWADSELGIAFTYWLKLVPSTPRSYLPHNWSPGGIWFETSSSSQASFTDKHRILIQFANHGIRSSYWGTDIRPSERPSGLKQQETNTILKYPPQQLPTNWLDIYSISEQYQIPNIITKTALNEL